MNWRESTEMHRKMKHKKTRRIHAKLCSMEPIMMSSSFLFFLLLVAYMPTQTSAFIAPRTGCYHNGSWYADNSYIPTREKCLNCECKSKNLVCRLKVCPEIPLPPPRGCVVVQKRNTCCPYISCARLELFERIPATRRIIAYLDHYERESIDRVVNDNMLQRRSDDSDIDVYVCVKNGTVYKSGSAMSSSNLCTYCYCIGGQEKCVKPKCMLPLEGCKPIFVDSTCCPVRYDCSQKISGKSSQEVVHTKISNKHFLRMSQRLQRNRGCTVGKQFYVEGQKMKSDADKHCDVCFCIRGNRKCAPKKCAPALKNCLPVVPKGQCCPSSYDCDHQRDYRRSHNSRQFNLFNLLFNDESDDTSKNNTLPEEYPHDRNPALALTEKYNGPAQRNESFFDKIRQGLEFIDTNNEKEKIPVSIDPQVNKEELSLLDLLLEPERDITLDEVIKEDMEEKTTMKSWLDILLGKDDEENEQSLTTEDSNVPNTTKMREISAVDTESPTEATTEFRAPTIIDINNDDSIKIKIANIFGKETPTESITTITITENPFVKLNLTQLFQNKTTETTAIKIPMSTPSTIKSSTPFKNLIKLNTTTPTTTITTTTERSSLLNAIFNGISGILSSEKGPNKTETQHSTNITATIEPTTKYLLQVPTQKPLPLFRPIPTNKTHTRINSKIANLTLNPNFLLRKPAVRNITQSYKTKPKSTTNPLTTKFKVSATVKPIPIKTILEADPLEPYVEPTLPPSLPNLKIIPFLPTDAVKSDRNKPTTYENYYNKSPIDKIDYDFFEDPNMYPLLTERFPSYGNVNDDNKAEYIYKFNIEGPPVSTISGLSVGNAQGFSPPSKTEGGFIPKESAITKEDQYQYIIDITTSNPLENITKHIIDITTPNIFKNVVRTETPPQNLISLMEEQEIAVSSENNKFLNTTENLKIKSDVNAMDTYSNLLQKTITSTTTTTSITAITPKTSSFKSIPSTTPIPAIKISSSLEPTATFVGTTPAKQSLNKKTITTMLTTTIKDQTRKLTKPQAVTTSPADSLWGSSVTSAVFQSPFDKLPSMDTSFNIKINERTTTSQNFVNTTTIGPRFPSPATSSTTTRSDPFGTLKLAGCNIYGRMYRVNRVIIELSNKCRECRCTEIGVECKRLDC